MTGTDRLRLSPRRQELLDALLRAEGIERSATTVVPRRPDPAAPVPLTSSQGRLWFLEHLAAHGSAYVIPAALRVHGEFRPEVFAQACDEVVRRHESLRTVFFDTGGQPYQQVRDDLRADVRIVDLQAVPADAADTEVGLRTAELIARPFDLGAGPLFRVELLRLGPAEVVVLLTMHHLVSDRWSMGVLLRELTHSYGALVTGRADALPELPVQYADFARWQQQGSSAAGWESDLTYWTRTLAGVPADLGLPADRPRPPEKTYRGSSVPVELPAGLVTELRTLAKAEGATVFMVLVAAFTLLVSRLSGTEDVVVGTPVANRTLVELEPLIGFFVNTAALRTDVTGDPSFRELLRRVRTTCLEAYEHQGVPFERLVEQLQPNRSLASTPVFQVMFSYSNVPFPAWRSGPIRIEPIQLEATKAEFDVLLDLFEDGDTVWGRLEYSVDLFDEATAVRFARMFGRLTRALAADPDRGIRELPLLGESERAEVLSWARGQERAWPGTGWVHECFEDQVRRDPLAEAVRSEGESVAYGELNRRANRLAHRLGSSGVGPGVPVGVAVRPSVELVVALLAVLKAGGAYLPLDPDDPGAGRVLADAGAPVLLTRRRVLDGLPAVDAEVLCVDELAGDLATESDDDPGVVVAGDELARMSCPPGRDGVLSTHRGLRNELLWLRDTIRLTASDRVLQKVPLPYDESAWELLLPLTVGATVVVARPEGYHDPAYLVETVRAEGITTAHLAPSVLAAVLRQPGMADCTSVRRVLCSGEPLPPAVAERFAACSRAELYDLSGPAGTPTGPTANTQLYVLDRDLRPVPVGVVGELCVGGPHLPRGYLSRPASTAARFVPDPFGAAGSRLHRTGDLGRLRPDGSVERLGRPDDHVTVSGFRVRPAEVESALLGHEAVSEAVVVARGGPGGARLVAYLTAVDANGVPPAAQLTAHLRQRLPDYMVPTAYVVLPAVPLTGLGTVDRPALPDLEAGGLEAQPAFVEPRDELERSVAALWRDLLGVTRVGVHDNFFALGGHSLLATKFAAQFRAAHGVRLPLREFFANPTVGELAVWLTDRQAGAPDAGAIPVADRGADLPLSFAQEGLCAHHPVDAEDPYHNVVTGLILAGPLDEAALRWSLGELVRRHEVLRTRIVRRPTGLAQQVDDAASWPLLTVDLRDLAEDTRQRELRRLVEAHGRQPFRLGAEPPVRGVLVRVAADEAALVLTMHHLVTDNWSYGVLVRDLTEFYDARTGGREPSLPELPVHYADFSVWQRRQLAGGALEDQLRYWRRQLADLPSALLDGAPDPAVAPATGSTRAFALDVGITRSLRDIGLQEDATLFMVLLAAFDVLLAAHSGGHDVPVAFPDAGRDRPETADLVGFFVNTLVVRADLSPGQSFRDLVGQVRSLTRDAQANAEVALWAVDRAPTGRDPARIVLNLLNAPIRPTQLRGLEVHPMDTGGDYVFSEVLGSLDPAAVDLALIVREHDSALRGTWLYSVDAVDPRVLSSMMDGWQRLVGEIVADPDADVVELGRRLTAVGTRAGGGL